VEDVDKEDIKRYYEFVDQKVADLLLVAQPTAKANDRIAVEPRDLPITKGLQESIHAFEALDLDSLTWISDSNVFWRRPFQSRRWICLIVPRLGLVCRQL
jgi:hypothetical protein